MIKASVFLLINSIKNGGITVEHCLKSKSGTLKKIKKAHLGEDGLSTRNYSIDF